MIPSELARYSWVSCYREADSKADSKPFSKILVKVFYTTRKDKADNRVSFFVVPNVKSFGSLKSFKAIEQIIFSLGHVPGTEEPARLSCLYTRIWFTPFFSSKVVSIHDVEGSIGDVFYPRDRNP